MSNKPTGSKIIFSAIIVAALLSACSGLKQVNEGQHLFSGHKLLIDSTQFLSDLSATKSELNDLITLKPNRKLLWMRPFLSLYYLLPEPKKDSGLRYWAKYKLGEPPVLLEDINLPNTAAAFENRLQNRGNFQAITRVELIRKEKTAKVLFYCSPGKPYTLQSIKFPEDSTGIKSNIRSLEKETLLKHGNTYNLKDFEEERNRIDKELKEQGYFFFKPDYILFSVDTAGGSRQMKTWLNLKPEMPVEASNAFVFNRIYVFDDYSLSDYRPDTTKIGDYFYVSRHHQFKPETILKAIFLEKDSLYARSDHYNTLRHLMGIGVYKFANARFSPDIALPEQMNVNIYLTPVRKISLSAEMSVAIKSNNFAGPGLNLNFKNRNVFGGAELLSITLGGNFETQVAGDSKGQTSCQVVLDASYALPNLIPEGLGRNIPRNFVPKTILSASGGIYSRVNLYEMHSFNSSAGYSWKSTENISHQFNPVEVSFTNLSKTSDEFENYLNENPTVRKSFEEQFILGASYNFVNSRFYLKNRKHSFYLSESFDLSGNLMSLLKGVHPDPENPYKLLGLAYSQFARLRSELRYFYTLSKKSQLAWRLIAGVGLPYGNSTTMPYVKQYYVGGTNSLRSFIARSVGPGSYHPPDSLAGIYVDQAGDVKLESSLEYRFDIYKFFKGALFVDAGNIWLVNEDPSRFGGKFNKKTFLSEIAMGTGGGFRFDFTFLILRFDLAFPLRKPYLPEGERWVFDDIDPGNASWRKDNILWNVAIGYPF